MSIKLFIETSDFIKVGLFNGKRLVYFEEFSYMKDTLDRIYANLVGVSINTAVFITHGIIDKGISEDACKAFSIKMNSEVYYCSVNNEDLSIMEHLAKSLHIQNILYVDKFGYYNFVIKNSTAVVDNCGSTFFVYTKIDNFFDVRYIPLADIGTATKLLKERYSLEKVEYSDNLFSKNALRNIEGLDLLKPGQLERISSFITVCVYASSKYSKPFYYNPIIVPTMSLNNCVINEKQEVKKNTEKQVGKVRVSRDLKEKNQEQLDSIEHENILEKDGTVEKCKKDSSSLIKDKPGKKSGKKVLALGKNIAAVSLLLIGVITYIFNIYITREVVALEKNQAMALSENDITETTNTVKSSKFKLDVELYKKILSYSVNGNIAKVTFRENEVEVLLYLYKLEDIDTTADTFSEIGAVDEIASYGTITSQGKILYKYGLLIKR